MKDVRIGTQNLMKEKRENTMREICKGTQERSPEKKEMFFVTYVCRSDIIYAFEDTDIFEEVKTRVNRMDDSDMERLASKMADDYCNQMFWESLKIIFEDRFLEQHEVPNGQTSDRSTGGCGDYGRYHRDRMHGMRDDDPVRSGRNDRLVRKLRQESTCKEPTP